MTARRTASCVCKPLYLETARISAGSSEDICRHCGLRIPQLCTKPFFNAAFHASKAGLSVILDKNANTLANK